MDFNYILFYGGTAVCGLSVFAAIIFFLIFHINKVKLNAEFDKEYGEEPDKRKEREEK